MAPPPNPPTPPTPPNPGDYANALADFLRLRQEAQLLRDDIEQQSKFLGNQKTLRSEILSLSKKLYEIQRDIRDLEDIELGEEIFVSYGDAYWKTRNDLEKN
jgi:cell division protein FtsL